MPFLRSLIFLSISTSLSIPRPPLLSSNVVQLCIELSSHTSVCPLTHTSIHPPIHPFTYSSIHSFIHAMHTFTHSFIHSKNQSTHPYIHPPLNTRQQTKQ